MLVATKHSCRLVGEEYAAEEGEQHTYPSAQHQRAREEATGLADVLLSQGIGHQHTGSGIDEQVERKDELVDGLGQVDGADAVFADEIAHDDAVDHIAQAARERHQDVSAEVVVKLLI